MSVGLLGVAVDVHAEVVPCVWGHKLEATLTDPEALLRRLTQCWQAVFIRTHAARLSVADP